MSAWFGAQLVPGALLCPHLLLGEAAPDGSLGAVYVRNDAGETMALCVMCIETLRPVLDAGDPQAVASAMLELGYRQESVEKVLADMAAA